MDERAKALPHERQEAVLQAHHDPHAGAIARVAGQQRAARQAGRGGEDGRAEGRAADNASQDDDVGRLDRVGCLDEVGENERRPIGDARRRGELARSILVARDHLDDRAARGAAANELDLDLADAATDLHDRRSVKPLLGRPVGDPRSVASAETLPEVASERPAGAPLPEDVERLTGAAARHIGMLAS